MLKGLKVRKADTYGMKGYESIVKRPQMSAYGGGDDFYSRYI